MDFSSELGRQKFQDVLNDLWTQVVHQGDASATTASIKFNWRNLASEIERARKLDSYFRFHGWRSSVPTTRRKRAKRSLVDD